MKESLSEVLLLWYDAHRRDLPWRGETDPYRIWLSEIMLQQTRTETVARYYARFLARFPTVFELAAAAEDDVLKLWEGLGYYSRARNLHAAAKCVVQSGGRFPETSAALRALPGVGPYAANAIASIAYGESAPALDGNQARVLSRILAFETPLKTPFDLAEPASSLISRTRPGDYNQALMDLGASICTSKRPRCEECPLSAQCLAWQSGDPESFPRKRPPIVKREETWTVIIALHGDTLYVRRRPSKGLLGGLYAFALLPGHDLPDLAAALEAQGLKGARDFQRLPDAKHVFTHLVWRMQGWLTEIDAACEDWIAVDSPDAVALPTALRVYRECAAQSLSERRA